MRRFLLILLALVITSVCAACTYQITFPDATAQQQTPLPQTVTEQQATLNFAFGSRNGTYTGEILNGLPNGYGAFSSVDSDQSSWVYEGSWVNGHMNGQGTTTWEDGFIETGLYVNDYLNGAGKEYYMNALQYEGSYKNGVFNGQGTLYDYHGEAIFTGNFADGFMQETAEQRYARIGAFKYESVELSYYDLYNYAQNQYSVRTKVYGMVFDVYEYSEGSQYYCDFLMYEQGVQDTGRIICVYHWLSEGEPAVSVGQYINVWGTTEYLYSYTSENNEYLTVPLINSWCVE